MGHVLKLNIENEDLCTIFLLITNHENKVHTFSSSSFIRFGSIFFGRNRNFFFHILLILSYFLGEYKFISQLENKPSPSKMI